MKRVAERTSACHAGSSAMKTLYCSGTGVSPVQSGTARPTCAHGPMRRHFISARAGRPCHWMRFAVSGRLDYDPDEMATLPDLPRRACCAALALVLGSASASGAEDAPADPPKRT